MTSSVTTSGLVVLFRHAENCRTAFSYLGNDMPAESLAILFVHHKVDLATCQNLASFRQNNPAVPVIPISTGPALPGGVSLADSPEAYEIWQRHTRQPGLAARSTDVAIYLWHRYLRGTIDADRWVIVEWDAYCNQSVQEFFGPVWKYLLSGPSVRWPNREPEWFWFKTKNSLPQHLHPWAVGIVPFCFILVDAGLLSRVVANVPWDHLGNCNSELRFATLCNSLGGSPVANPNAGPNITWQPLYLASNFREVPGMWHPIKQIYPELSAEFTPRKPTAKLTGWSILEDDYNWLILHVKEHNIRNVLEFGPGDSTLAFLDAGCKVISFESNQSFLVPHRNRFSNEADVTLLHCPADQVPDAPQISFTPELVFVDGPPLRPGETHSRRAMCEWALRNYGQLILHDARRKEEQATLKLLEAAGAEVSLIPTRKGLAVVRKLPTAS